MLKPLKSQWTYGKISGELTYCRNIIMILKDGALLFNSMPFIQGLFFGRRQ